MKNLTLTLICITFLFSCKKETSQTIAKGNTTKTEIKNSSSIIEDFDCATFFKKGNYSSMCFSDTKLPKYMSRGCIFDFVTKGDKQEQSIQIQFVDKKKSSLAEMHFSLNKNNYKKGKTTDVANLGDDAFFDVHSTDLKSLSRSNKDLYVRFKNITFTIMAEYKSNTVMPCFYDDKNLIAFAKTIIENL